MQIFYEGDQASMFDPALPAGKTSPALSPAERPRARTSASYWRRCSELVYRPFMFMKITPGAGNILGRSYWEILSPYVGDALTLNTGVSPRVVVASSLWRILEAHPHRKYYLSRKACLGILRRARKRGKELPPHLKLALELQSGLRLPDILTLAQLGLLKAYHINQRDEGIDLDDKAGALMATANQQMQTFVAGFSAGAGASAGGIGYRAGLAPTLKAGAGGNSMPSVLCLNDQGSSVMDASEDMTGALRAQQHGHQPVVMPEVYCITGNAIDRQPQNGGNGIGYQADVAYTLNTMDRHAVYRRQRVDSFTEDVLASTQSARQSKDATDLVLYTCDLCGDEELPFLLIRRLTPLECERLQGFPDGWTDVPGASDSARYKALGNSVAIPCVDFVMKCMADAIRRDENISVTTSNKS